MAKKKPTAKSKAMPAQPSKAARPKSGAENRRSAKPPASRPASAEVYTYRYEVHGNSSNAPLIVDIPIAEGRGEQPHRPSFVGFTAEMAEEQWPDQFAFRLISLENSTVRVMISRIDNGSPEQGWGATLVVHVLVVDRVTDRTSA